MAQTLSAVTVEYLHLDYPLSRIRILVPWTIAGALGKILLSLSRTSLFVEPNISQNNPFISHLIYSILLWVFRFFGKCHTTSISRISNIFFLFSEKWWETCKQEDWAMRSMIHFLIPRLTESCKVIEVGRIYGVITKFTFTILALLKKQKIIAQIW